MLGICGLGYLMYDLGAPVITFIIRCNKWKKRGLAIIPNKYCLAFGIKFLNQGGALLHVYTDGSILLTHGGMEMGQGLHTKMAQVRKTIFCKPTSL